MKLIDKYNYYKDMDHFQFRDFKRKHKYNLDHHINTISLDNYSTEFGMIRDFLEIYYCIENSISEPWVVMSPLASTTTFQPMQSVSSRYGVVGSNPDVKSFYEVNNIFTKLIDDYKTSKNVIHKIEYEYFNSHTKKRGLMLENGLMVEDNEIVNLNVTNNTLTDLIQNKIKWILYPEKRKSMEREKKLNRIL